MDGYLLRMSCRTRDHLPDYHGRFVDKISFYSNPGLRCHESVMAAELNDYAIVIPRNFPINDQPVGSTLPKVQTN